MRYGATWSPFIAERAAGAFVEDASGRRVLDFGRSTPDDGTHQFKEQWGAVSEQLHWEYVLTGAADAPGDDRHSPKYRALIEGWKHLPVWAATAMGPRIARCVP